MKCTQCQKSIIGTGVTYNGKKYCATCYQNEIAKAAQYDNLISEIQSYMCFLFNYDEFPADWDYQLRSLIKNDKKTPYGIKMTLYYVYEVEGESRDPEYVFYNIRSHYEAASLYVQKQREVSNYNEGVEIKNQHQTVVINRPVNTGRKLDYDISDL